MATQIQCPDFPIFTWKPELGNVIVTVNYNGTDEVGSISAGGDTYWGFSQNTAGTTNTDSIAYILAQTIEDIMVNQHGEANFQCTATLINSLTSGEEVEYVLGLICLNNAALVDDITVSISNPEPFGFSSDTNTFVFATTGTTLATAYSEFSVDGIWRPYDRSVTDLRFEEAQVNRSVALYSDSTYTVHWGNVKTRRAISIPFVYAAMIFPYRRIDSTFATPARVSTSSPNNILTKMMQAARDNKQFRIYHDYGEYRLAQYIGDGDKDLETILEDQSPGKRITVDLAFVDQGDDGTGAI